jgi:hypothetical protein
MSTIANYCPDDVNCLAFGIKLDGFADGTFISIVKDRVPFTMGESADGVPSRLFNKSQTYTIALTFHCGSPSNDVLTKFWLLDELTKKGRFPLFIKDLSGTDLFFSTSAWIEGVPTVTKSSTMDTRVWVLRATQSALNVGSNQDPSSILQDLINIAGGLAGGIVGDLF